MDYSELDEEEKQRKKTQKIEWQRKKRNSTLFMVAATVFEVIVSILLIIVFFCISALLIFRVFKLGEAGRIPFEILTLISFLGGMILGFVIYKAAARWAIKAFNLKEKISEDVLLHYKKLTKEEKLAEKNKKLRK